MRATSAAILLALLLPLACDAPLPTTAPNDKSVAIIFPNSWVRADLPFVPAGINDSGAIIGTINNTAVRYLNGTLITLPPPAGRVVVAAASFLPPPEFHPPYMAVAIANTGHIVGRDGNMLLWTSLTQTPREMTYGAATVLPNAINDADMVVGTAGGTPFRWTPAHGFQVLASPVGYQPIATVVNDAGYVAGYAEPVFGDPPELLVRWDPSGTVTTHPRESPDLPENRPAGIDAAGDVLATSGDVTYIWSVNGGTTIVSGVPSLTRTEGWSSLGRIIGHTIGGDNHPWTMFQGTVTFLPQPTPADEADIPTGVNTCGTIVSTRVNNGAQLDSGYVWRHSLFCDAVTSTFPGPLANRLSTP